MKLCVLASAFTVCKIDDGVPVDLNVPYTFLSRTHEERSLVCPTGAVPEQTLEREDGWRAFYVDGVLDFSLIGILARISGVLAEEKIGLFAVSTYNTDYILTKADRFGDALAALQKAGYEVEQAPAV